MKISKKLSDYIHVKVQHKLTIPDTYEKEREYVALAELVSNEISEKLSEDLRKHCEEAEKKHPILKDMTVREKIRCDVYTYSNSKANKLLHTTERAIAALRVEVVERIELRLELSNDLTLDEIDTVIEEELKKAGVA